MQILLVTRQVLEYQDNEGGFKARLCLHEIQVQENDINNDALKLLFSLRLMTLKHVPK